MLCSVKNLGLPMVKALGKWFTGYTFGGNVLAYFKMLYNAVAPLAKNASFDTFKAEID